MSSLIAGVTRNLQFSILICSCQCDAGYEGSGIQCREINPCTKPNRGGCHHEAICTKTGPGTNNCTCGDGFRGDGIVCVAIDPCQEKGAGYCHSNAKCQYVGPGQVSIYADHFVLSFFKVFNNISPDKQTNQPATI